MFHKKCLGSDSRAGQQAVPPARAQEVSHNWDKSVNWLQMVICFNWTLTVTVSPIESNKWTMFIEHLYSVAIHTANCAFIHLFSLSIIVGSAISISHFFVHRRSSWSNISLSLNSKQLFCLCTGGPPGATNSYQVGVNHGQGGGTSYQKVKISWNATY